MSLISKKPFLISAFALWVGLSIYWVSLLHAGHMLSFQNQVGPRGFQQLISSSNPWTLIHVFAPQCTCSDFLLKELSSRRPAPGTHEIIVTLGNFPAAEKMRALGYEVVEKDMDQLKTEEEVLIEGVPFFVVAKKDRSIAYAGGYADEKITPTTPLKYLQVFNELKSGHTVTGLPVKGCAVSEKYQRMLNPFGLSIASQEKNKTGVNNERIPSSVQ